MEIPLGKPVYYTGQYSPELLAPIPRAESRGRLGEDFAFTGVDIWNAWELTWLRSDGRPEIAAAEIRIPADSTNIIESKSLKLYLNSFSMTRMDSHEGLARRIEADLGAAAGAAVGVSMLTEADHRQALIGYLPGASLDQIDIDCDATEPSPALLRADFGKPASEALTTDLFRSLCPVTSQPDLASVCVDYRGPRIDPGSLLRYIVSFREHQDFHEACVERMFVDIMERCRPEKLCVYARFQRRGGIDINPWRANYDAVIRNIRLWRQ